MSLSSYFKILGISPTKNEALIKKAYRKKALKYHPDRNPTAAAKDKFIEVTEAYENILEALERGIDPNSTSQNRTSYRQTSTQRTRTRQKTASEIREERIKKARMRYEQNKRREAEENDAYFRTLTNGKWWKRFKRVMYVSTLISLLMTLDMLYFPAVTEVSQIVKVNTSSRYSGANKHSTSPVKFENGQKAWLSQKFIEMSKYEYLYLEKTPLFKDIKYVKVWQFDRWVYYTPDYSLPSTFPLIPFVLLFPLLTYFIKSKTFTFTIFFHLSMYAIPLFLFVVMFSNDRWIHLLTFGLI